MNSNKQTNKKQNSGQSINETSIILNRGIFKNKSKKEILSGLNKSFNEKNVTYKEYITIIRSFLGDCDNCIKFYENTLENDDVNIDDYNFNHCCCNQELEHHILKGEYVLIYNSGVRKNVSKRIFSKLDGRVYEKDDLKYRFIDSNMTKTEERNVIFKEETLSDIYTGVKNSLYNVAAFSKLVNNIKGLSTQLCLTVSSNKNMLQMLVLDLVTLFSNIQLVIVSALSIKSIILMLLNIFRTFEKIRWLCSIISTGNTSFIEKETGMSFFDTIKSFVSGEDFEEEAFEEILMSAAIHYLPPTVRKIVADIKNISNRKFSDDTAFFASILGKIHKAIIYLMKCTHIPVRISEYMEDVLECTPISKQYDLINRARVLIRKYAMDRKKTFDKEYQDEIILLHSEMGQYKLKFHEVFNMNKILRELEICISKINRSVLSYTKASQTEPCCYVFEGPPGSGKSLLAVLVAKSFKTPVYVHHTPPPDFGKDFHDTYEGEKVYLEDDVGQQSPSQWSNIINFVSPIPCPLMCASVDLKNTKYFTSEILILTTNHLRSLSLSKDDGISDVNALYRRCSIFDSTGLVTVNGKVSGTLKFLTFNKGSKKYEEGFSSTVEEYLSSKNLYINTRCTGDEVTLTIWAKKIILAQANAKKECNNHDNQLDLILKTSNEDEEISVLMEDFNFESLFSKDYEKFFTLSTFKRLKEIFCDNMLLVSFVSSILVSSVLLFNVLLEKRFVKEDLLMEMDYMKEMSVQAPEGVRALSKNVRSCVLTVSKPTKSQEVFCVATVTQRLVILPAHALKNYIEKEDDLYITIYSDHFKRTIDYDKVKCSLVRVIRDMAFIMLGRRLPIMMPNIMTHLSRPHSEQKFLVTPMGFLNADKSEIYANEYSGHEVAPDSLYYRVSKPGLCGSLLVDVNANIIGMHVAGNGTYGISQRFSETEKSYIYSLLEERTSSYNAEYSVPKKDGVSVSKLSYTPIYQRIPHKTHLVPSSVIGISPIMKEPANLMFAGVGSVKDIASKSFTPVEGVTKDALDFAKIYMYATIPKFDSISRKDAIKGNIDKNINPMLKDTSNGYGYEKDRTKYINFEEGKFTEEFDKRMENYLRELKNGKMDLKNHLSVELLKDELREIAKLDKPRSFRMFPLHINIQGKIWFAELAAKIQDKKFDNGIMIGINPFKDFDQLYRKLTYKSSNIFCSDFGKWDGKMLPQMMRVLNEVLLDRYQGEDKEELEQFLECVVQCPVVVFNEVFMTTHALGSGMSITALYNSLINKMYEAYFYVKIAERTKGYTPSLMHFSANIFGVYYGDDKVVSVDDKIAHFYNAVTVAEEAKSIGLDVTTATKQLITEPFDSIIVFLKRTFVFHERLNMYVGKLDTVSMLSTLNYVSDRFRIDELSEIKLQNCQRELFLHEDIYESEMQRMRKYLREINFPVTFLSEDYLVDLYMWSPEEYGAHLPTLV
jgi:hypothetical protein